MHLTNYAVNKHNTAAFVAPTTAAATATPAAKVDGMADSNGSSDGSTWQQQQQHDVNGEASKWSFEQLRQHLEGQGE